MIFGSEEHQFFVDSQFARSKAKIQAKSSLFRTEDKIYGEEMHQTGYRTVITPIDEKTNYSSFELQKARDAADISFNLAKGRNEGSLSGAKEDPAESYRESLRNSGFQESLIHKDYLPDDDW